MPISEVVHVTISVQDASVAQAAFNKPLIAAYHTVGTGNDLIRDYTDQTAFETDFASFPAVLKAGAAFWSQNPRPATLSVGRLTEAPTKIVRCDPTFNAATTYNLFYNGTPIGPVSPGANLAALITALGAAIDAVAPGTVTVTTDGTGVILTGNAGVWFDIWNDGPGEIAVYETTADTTPLGLAAQLSAISAIRDDWYALVITNKSEVLVNAAATWTEARRKIFGAFAGNPDILTGSSTDVASDQSTKNRVFVGWHQNPGSFPEMAWISEEFPYDPGSRNWNFKRLASISPSDRFLSGTAVTNAKGKRASLIRTLGGVTATFGNKMGSGRYIDVTLATDWLTARIEERLYGVLLNNGKVPYTDAGLALLENEVRAQLQEGVEKGVLADDENLSVSVVKVASQNPTDRAARIVRGLKFRARLAGAVDEIFVEGTVFP